MARCKRVKGEAGAYYHIYGKPLGGNLGPFAHRGVRDSFVQAVKSMVMEYWCELVAYVVMGDHYHLVLKFKHPDRLTKRKMVELAHRRHAYWDIIQMKREWSDEQWQPFRERAQDVSALMRDLHSGFARTCNRERGVRGRFWNGRFRSTLLETREDALRCALYIELNPVRSGLAEKPEQYYHSSAHDRLEGASFKLMHMWKIHGYDKPPRSKTEVPNRHRAQLYHYGGIEEQMTCPPTTSRTRCSGAIFNFEVQDHAGDSHGEPRRTRPQKTFGIFLKHLRFITSGLVLGTKQFVTNVLRRLHTAGYLTHRTEPIPHLSGTWMSACSTDLL